MELLAIARILWRHRVLAALGAPLMVAIALLATNRISLSPLSLSPPLTATGAASAKVLVDTPNSQLVDLGQSLPVGLDGSTADGLPVRVSLLADELESDDWRTTLARSADIPASQIDLASSNAGAAYATPLARRLLEANAAAGRPYVVRIFTDRVNPIVTISATAPTAADAQRLVEATIVTFKGLVEGDRIAKRFTTRPLGSPRVGMRMQASSRAMTLAVGFAALAVWLVGIFLACGVAAAWARSRP